MAVQKRELMLILFPLSFTLKRTQISGFFLKSWTIKWIVATKQIIVSAYITDEKIGGKIESEIARANPE